MALVVVLSASFIYNPKGGLFSIIVAAPAYLSSCNLFCTVVDKAYYNALVLNP